VCVCVCVYNQYYGDVYGNKCKMDHFDDVHPVSI